MHVGVLMFARFFRYSSKYRMHVHEGETRPVLGGRQVLGVPLIAKKVAVRHGRQTAVSSIIYQP